jgi:hypothetical protein
VNSPHDEQGKDENMAKYIATMLPHLVGGFNPSEKYESHMGLLFPVYGKIKFMFQTTINPH